MSDGIQKVFLTLFVFFTMLAIGAGLTTVQRHYELAQQLPVEAPAACQANGQDQCAETLTHPEYGKPLGIPTATWGLGTSLLTLLTLLWLSGALWIDDEKHIGLANLALGTLAGVMLLGTGAFLVIGLGVLKATCALCLWMHALNVVLVIMVGVSVFVMWPDEFSDQLESSWRLVTVTGTLFVYLLVVVIASTMLDAKYDGAYDHWRSWKGTLDTRLPGGCTCPPQVVYPKANRPGAGQSLVLSRGSGPDAPVFLEVLDAGCPACQKQHKALEAHYDDLLGQGKVGLEIVLYSTNKKCNASHRGGDKADSCAGNAAILCVHKHGGAATKTVDYLKWEYAEPNRMKSRQARQDKVRELAGEDGAQCFERERKHTNGELKAHYEYARETMSRQTRTMEGRGCEGNDAKSWWCFHGTPTMAIFDDTPPRGSNAPNLHTIGPQDRWLFIEPCLK